MKKSIKLIITCLLLCICCFGVISCGNIKESNIDNNISSKISNSLKNRGHNNYDFDINTNTASSKKEKDNCVTIEEYRSMTNKIRDEIKKLSE